MNMLIELHYLTRREFERNLDGLTDEDARKRMGKMNCISWIIAHVACQMRAFYVDWPRGKELDERYKPYGYQAKATQPPLAEAMELWREACRDSDAWLQSATEESLLKTYPSIVNENGGTLLARSNFHTWFHLGEINSIRQMLGHDAAQYVEMYGWSYGNR
jgi:hypothetical protein